MKDQQDFYDKREADEKQRIKDVLEYNLSNDLKDKLKDKAAERQAAIDFKKQKYAEKDWTKSFKLIDWKHSPLFQKLHEDVKHQSFNYEKDSTILTQEEVEYSVNLLRYCGERDFKELPKLLTVFYKGIKSLEVVMEELSIEYMFTRILNSLYTVDAQETLKILVRLKLLLNYRGKLVKIFKAIEVRERDLKNLNYAVVKGDEDSLGDGLDDPIQQKTNQDKRNKTIHTKI